MEDVKLTRQQHSHLEKQELKTLEQLEAECSRQWSLIPDDAVIRSICNLCQESVWEARKLKNKGVAK